MSQYGHWLGLGRCTFVFGYLNWIVIVCHVLILLIKKGETTFKSMKRVKITVHERTFNVKSKSRMTL